MSAPSGFKIGQAWLSIVPNMDDFSEKLRAELDGTNEEYTVKVTADTAALRESIAAATSGGKSVGIQVNPDSRGFEEKLEAALTKDRAEVKVKTVLDESSADQAGKDAGEDFSKSFSGRAKNAVRTGLDDTWQGIRSDAGETGSSSASSLGREFLKSSTFGKGGAIVTAAGSALALLPALGAIGGAGMVIGLGAAIATQLPSVQKQFQVFGKSAMGTLEQAVKPMVPYINGAMKQVSGFLKQIEPELSGLFKSAGPLIQPLLGGLEQLVKGLLPGLQTILSAATPAVDAFGGVLGSIGKDLGSMFKDMAPAVEPAAKVMTALFDAVGKLLPVIGKLAGLFAQSLAPVLSALLGAFKAIEPAILTVAGLFAKMSGAILTSLSGTLVLIGKTIVALAPSFDALVKAVGGIFTVLENSGVLFILENAFAQLLPVLAEVINKLITGLAPVLPQIIKLFGQFVTLIAGQAGTALTGLLNLLLPLVGPLTEIVKWVIQLIDGALKPLLPVLAIATVAWYALDLAMDMNPFSLIALAVVALAAVIVKFHKQILDSLIDVWDDVKKAFEDAWDAVSDFAKKIWDDITGTFTSSVSKIVSFLKNAWDTISGTIKSAWNDITDFFKFVWTGIYNFVENEVNTIESFLKNAWNTVYSVIQDAWNAIKEFFMNWWNSEYNFVQGMITTILGYLKTAWNAVYAVIQDVWNTIKSWFTSWWNTIYGNFQNEITMIRNLLLTAWHTMANDIYSVFGSLKTFFSSFWGDIESGFRSAVSAISSIWNGIKSAVQVPVNFIVGDIYDKGIAPLVNSIGSIVGLPKLNQITGFAEGGVLPGYAPGHDVIPAVLSPGESVLTPGATRELGADTINALNARNRPSGLVSKAGHYGGGGIIGGLVGDVTGAVKGAVSTVADITKDSISELRDLTGTALADGVSAALKGVLGAIPGGNTVLGKAIKDIPVKMVDDLVTFIKGHDSGGSGPSSGPAGGATGASSANGFELYKYLLTNVFGGSKVAAAGAAASIYGESGWNPFAVEPGGPSGGRGLIQWTPNSAISDAAYNGGMATQLPAIIQFISSSGDWGTIAAMKGAKSVEQAAYMWGQGVERYGIPDVTATGVSLATAFMTEKGYAGGTSGASRGWARVGERGEELVYFHGGETVLSNSATRRVQGVSPGGYALGTPVAPASLAGSMPQGARAAGGSPTVNFYGTQYPNAEQIANIKMELSTPLAGLGV